MRRTATTKQMIEARVVGAVILFSFGGYFLATSTTHQSYESTFNLEPGLARGLWATLPSGSGIAGNFHETNGSLVSLYIMTSAEWASLQRGSYAGSLYQQLQVTAGDFSYTTQTSDTFYLVFDHGSGLANSYETVTVSRDYAIPHPTTQGFGILGVGLGGLSTFVAVRAWRKARTQSP